MQGKVQDELRRIQDWSRSDQLELLEGLAALLRQQDRPKFQPPRKTRELRSVGRETWQDVDVEEYLGQERASWDD